MALSAKQSIQLHFVDAPVKGRVSSLLLSIGVEGAVIAAAIVVPLMAAAVPEIEPVSLMMVAPAMYLPPPPPVPTRPPTTPKRSVPAPGVPSHHTIVPLDQLTEPEELFSQEHGAVDSEAWKGLENWLSNSRHGSGKTPSVVAAPPPSPPVEPQRVGALVQAPRKTHHVAPTYPEIARLARVQGAVILEATISADGRVQGLSILRSVPLLDAAALDAVSQWRYEPTRLNGTPIPVITTVTVRFVL